MAKQCHTQSGTNPYIHSCTNDTNAVHIKALTVVENDTKIALQEFDSYFHYLWSFSLSF